MDVPHDSTLTAKNVVNSLQIVTHWFELGVQLDIRSDELIKIRKDWRDTDPCKLEMVIHWLKIDPTASWKKLYDALENINEPLVAQRIADNFPELKRKCESERLQKLALKNINDRIENERYEQRQKERDEQMQQKAKRKVKSAQQTISMEEKEVIQDALCKQRIESAYDVLIESAVRVKLEDIEHRMQVKVEEGRFYMEQAKTLQVQRNALCNRMQEFKEMEEYFCQDKADLTFQTQKLQQFSWLQWLPSLPSVIVCNYKLRQRQESLKRCKAESQICKERLKCTEGHLSKCRDKVILCISEMHDLQKEYEQCSRNVKDNINKVKKEMPNLIPIFETLIIAAGAVVGATVIALAGSKEGGSAGAVVGGMCGAVVGGVSGASVGGSVLTKLSAKERFQKEINACEDTLKKCQAVSEEIENIIENLTHINWGEPSLVPRLFIGETLFI